MPVGGQTAVALAFRKASRSPSLPAMKYAAPSASKSPRRLSKRDWIIQSPICQDGGARALILCKDSAGRGEVTPDQVPYLIRVLAQCQSGGAATARPAHACAARGERAPARARPYW